MSDIGEEIDLKKRYWLLTYDYHYPMGGFEDIQFTTDDLSSLRKFINENIDGYFDHLSIHLVDKAQIFDSFKREVIWDKGKNSINDLTNFFNKNEENSNA